MSSPAKPQAAGALASQPVFPDEILEEIFVRLDAVEDLARAAAACTTFRRVVSARRFLHRFRGLHPPPVLGVLDFDAPGALHPAAPPHRSAAAARALAQAADFTFSFLRTPHLWKVCDARDGRVLLYRRIGFADYKGSQTTTAFADLVVCDPLYRRHVQLPPIPDDLAAATGGSGRQIFDPFLDPDTDKDKEEQDLSFRVICFVQCEHKLVTFNFASVTEQWRGITYNRDVPLDSAFLRYPKLLERHYAHGCYFWMFPDMPGISNMVMLNMHDMKLSSVHLPPGRYGNRQRAIVEVGEGMIGLFTLSDNMLQLYYKSLGGWQHERIIPLPKLNSYSYWSILDAAAGYLLLQATPRDSSESQYFTLNLKTFIVEGLCVLNKLIRGAHLYASFTSPFSLPSIQHASQPGLLKMMLQFQSGNICMVASNIMHEA